MNMHCDNDRTPSSSGNAYRNSVKYATAIEHFPASRRLRRKSWLRLLLPVFGLALLGTLALIALGSAHGW